jgi:hypothetical protein
MVTASRTACAILETTPLLLLVLVEVVHRSELPNGSRRVLIVGDLGDRVDLLL